MFLLSFDVKYARFCFEFCPAKTNQLLISVTFPPVSGVRSALLGVAYLIVASSIGAAELAEVGCESRVGFGTKVGIGDVVLFKMSPERAACASNKRCAA